MMVSDEAYKNSMEPMHQIKSLNCLLGRSSTIMKVENSSTISQSRVKWYDSVSADEVDMGIPILPPAREEVLLLPNSVIDEQS